MSNRIFLSHSSRDKELVNALIRFFTFGMNLSRDEVFCTSMEGALPAGEAFIPRIKENLHNCSGVLFLLSENYLHSPFCVAELGAAWALGQNILPLVVPPVDDVQYNRTPLSGIHFLRLDGRKTPLLLQDILKKWGFGANDDIAFTDEAKVLSEFIDDYLLYLRPDAEGWYSSRILEKLSKPSPADGNIYNMLKLDGLIRNQEKPIPGETHWIQYRRDLYGDAEVGNRIMFSDPKAQKLFAANVTRNFYISGLKVFT